MGYKERKSLGQPYHYTSIFVKKMIGDEMKKQEE